PATCLSRFSLHDALPICIAHSVMRRPVVYLVACLGVMLALSVPILRLEPGGVDERVLPEGTEVREVAAVLEADFPPNATSPIDVVVIGDVSDDELADHVDRLAEVPGVEEAEIVGTDGDFHQLRLDHELDWQSSEARELVADVRSEIGRASCRGRVWRPEGG